MLSSSHSDPNYLLFSAADRGDLKKLQELIHDEADVNAIGLHNRTALIIAAKKGYFEIVKTLLDAGADVNAQGKNGDLPLHLAIYSGRVDIIKLLIAYGADVNAQGKNRDLPLHSAIYSGRVDIIKLLIAYGANVNAQDNDGDLPIHFAVNLRHFEIFKELLQAGANINTPNLYGNSLLHLTAINNCVEIFKLLFAAGAKVNTPNKDGNPPLHLAVINNSIEIFKELLNAGADPNAKNMEGVPLLSITIIANKLDYAQIIIQAGADVNANDSMGITPLAKALETNNREAVELLLAHNAYVDRDIIKISSDRVSIELSFSSLHFDRYVKSHINNEPCEWLDSVFYNYKLNQYNQYINRILFERLANGFINDKNGSDKVLSKIRIYNERTHDDIVHLSLRYLQNYIEGDLNFFPKANQLLKLVSNFYKTKTKVELVKLFESIPLCNVLNHPGDRCDIKVKLNKYISKIEMFKKLMETFGFHKDEDFNDTFGYIFNLSEYLLTLDETLFYEAFNEPLLEMKDKISAAFNKVMQENEPSYDKLISYVEENCKTSPFNHGNLLVVFNKFIKNLIICKNLEDGNLSFITPTDEQLSDINYLIELFKQVQSQPPGFIAYKIINNDSGCSLQPSVAEMISKQKVPSSISTDFLHQQEIKDAFIAMPKDALLLTNAHDAGGENQSNTLMDGHTSPQEHSMDKDFALGLLGN